MHVLVTELYKHRALNPFTVQQCKPVWKRHPAVTVYVNYQAQRDKLSLMCFKVQQIQHSENNTSDREGVKDYI